MPARDASGRFVSGGGTVIGSGVVQVRADTSAVDKGMQAMAARMRTALGAAASVASKTLLAIPRAFLAGMREAIQAAAAALTTFSSTARGIIGRPMSALRSPMGMLLGAAGIGASVVGIKKVVMAASDLNEAINKVEVVFGSASQAVVAGADEMARRFGIPKKQFIDSAAALGLIAKAAGMTQDKAAALGVQFAKLGADAASFYNVPLDEALIAMRAGLVGESEPLRRFGVLLNEDAVKAEALRLGITGGTKELTEGMKVQARASLIIKGMTDATGDLERTSGALANRIRELWGRIQNLAASIGQFLLPAAQALTGVFNEMAQGVEAALARNAGILKEWGESLRKAAEMVGVIFRNFAQVKIIAKAAFGDIGKNLMAVLKAFTANLVNWADYLGKVIGEAIKEGITGALAGTALGQLLGINKAVKANKVPRPQFVAPQFQQNPAIDNALKAIERAELGRAAVEAGRQAMGRVGDFGRKFLVFMNKPQAAPRGRNMPIDRGPQDMRDADIRQNAKFARERADQLRDLAGGGGDALKQKLSAMGMALGTQMDFRTAAGMGIQGAAVLQGGRPNKRMVGRAEEKAQRAERAKLELDLADEGIPLDMAAKLGVPGAGQRLREAPTRDRMGRLIGVGQEQPRFQAQYHGIEEFAKQIQLGALSSPNEDPAKKTAKNTEIMAGALMNIDKKIKDGAQVVAVAVGPE